MQEVLVVCVEPHHLVVVGSHYTLTKCTATQTVTSIAIHILHWSLFESDLLLPFSFNPHTKHTHTHTHTYTHTHTHTCRGYGDTDRPEGAESYTLDKLGEDIAQLIPALGYSACVLVGHDWGGAVAWCVCCCVVVVLCVRERERVRVFTLYLTAGELLTLIQISLTN